MLKIIKNPSGQFLITRYLSSNKKPKMYVQIVCFESRSTYSVFYYLRSQGLEDWDISAALFALNNTNQNVAYINQDKELSYLQQEV